MKFLMRTISSVTRVTISGTTIQQITSTERNTVSVVLTPTYTPVTIAQNSIGREATTIVLNPVMADLSTITDTSLDPTSMAELQESVSSWGLNLR
jgi:hypothetical protein